MFRRFRQEHVRTIQLTDDFFTSSTTNEEDKEKHLLVYFAFLVFPFILISFSLFHLEIQIICLLVIYNKLWLSTQITKMIVDAIGRSGLDLKVMTKNNCCTNKI